MAMTVDPGVTGGPWPVAADGSLLTEARLLRTAVLDSVRTSPDAFSRTFAEIEAKPASYWGDEVQASSWAVLEVEGDVVGIAAAKRPDPYTDPQDRKVARFIESVWIAPEQRRHGFGQRLVEYLIETQLDEGFREFYLWVFEDNRRAIELYERMGFEDAPVEPHLIYRADGSAMNEIQYRRLFDSAPNSDARALTSRSRRRDERKYKASYRLLRGRLDVELQAPHGSSDGARGR
jgi:ribosomal protein S18 acetylase RimI-like enzyme